MARNRNRRDDRIDRGSNIDNPRIKPERQPERPQAGVVTPRTYKGSDFRDFPRLVVQLGRPRPKARVGGAARSHDEADPSAAPSSDPKEGFARPLRGMGVNRYDGLRDEMKPQLESYRSSLHDAYKDDGISEEERKALRGQRRDLRQDVREYKSKNPLQMGLGAKMEDMVRSRPVREMDEIKGRTPGVVKGQQDPSPAGGPVGQLSIDQIRELQEAWKSGRMSPEEILAALGFTGKMPTAGRREL